MASTKAKNVYFIKPTMPFHNEPQPVIFEQTQTIAPAKATAPAIIKVNGFNAITAFNIACAPAHILVQNDNNFSFTMRIPNIMSCAFIATVNTPIALATPIIIGANSEKKPITAGRVSKNPVAKLYSLQRVI